MLFSSLNNSKKNILFKIIEIPNKTTHYTFNGNIKEKRLTEKNIKFEKYPTYSTQCINIIKYKPNTFLIPSYLCNNKSK